MKLLCVKDVVMIPDGDIAFKQGQYYEFGINSSGEIHRSTDNTMHMFRAYGPDAWTNYFVKELEGVK